MNPVELLTLWVSFSAAGALLVRVGQAITAVGTARSKNAVSAVARNLCDASATILFFSLVGTFFLTRGLSTDLTSTAALTLHFTIMALIASGIIAPAVAERSKPIVPLVGSVLISAVLFPLAGRSVWRGWLFERGFIDVAGAVPIHLTGALCALAASYFVGPRMGKYNHDGSTSIIPAHQASMLGLGTLAMLAGWLPYVMGSALLRESSAAAATAGMNALVAAAAGALGALLSGRLRSSRIDLSAVCAGLLSGAVSMTAAAGGISSWQAALLGLAAGLITSTLAPWMEFRWRIDDPGGLIVPHGVGAIVAVLGAAFFSQDETAGMAKAVAVQSIGLLCCAAMALSLSCLVFFVLGRLVTLRVSEGDEFDGLDLAQHDVNAYPDFQQTTIKSYHLREA